MLNKLHTLREQRKQDDKGFTLIELLVVVVIIGILIAIAIPLYLNYQKGAKNKSAQSDVRNAIVAVEQCYTEANNTYPASAASAGNGATITLSCSPGTDQTINVSDGNTVTYTFDSTANTYTIAGKNNTGGNKTYTYSSATGKTT